MTDELRALSCEATEVGEALRVSARVDSKTDIEYAHSSSSRGLIEFVVDSQSV